MFPTPAGQIWAMAIIDSDKPASNSEAAHVSITNIVELQQIRVQHSAEHFGGNKAAWPFDFPATLRATNLELITTL